MAHSLKLCVCVLLLFLVDSYSLANESTTQFRFRTSSRYAWPRKQGCSRKLPACSGKTVPLVHWNSRWSPHCPEPKLSQKDLLRNDKHRLNSLYQNDNTTLWALSTSSGVTMGAHQFVLLLSKPFEDKSLIFIDTATELSWSRCNRLKSLQSYSQSSISSRRAGNIPCSPERRCTSVGYRCDDLGCFMSYQYQNGSYSSGHFSQKKAVRIAEELTYGCDYSGGTTSVIGLGWERMTLSTQVTGMHNGFSSYCLPEDDSMVGFMSFGASPPLEFSKATDAYPSFLTDRRREPKEVIYTPILSNSDTSSLYFIGLIRLSVGGQNLDLPEAVFTGVGTVLDADTTISYLPPEAYTMLRDTFRSFMARYRPAGSFSVLDTSYNFTGMRFREVGVPLVGLLFENGVTYELSFDATVYYTSESGDEEIGCLAFAATKETGRFSVIGNVQQRR